jgi:magnesium transporter
VAKKFAKYDLLALPVVSPRKEMRGIITVDDVIDIIEDETTEDIYAMAAVGAPVDYLGAGILKIWRQRAPWLLLLVFSGFLAGFVIEFFKDALSKYVELIFFIPLLMGSGGNAGTQASTVIVRGLATGELSPSLFLRVLWIEMRVGLLVGLTMGALAAARAYILPTHSGLHLQIALAVGGTMFLVVTAAKSIGSMLPLLFKRMGLDPALMSNPLIQSIMDILTLTLYFGLAKLFLPL